LGVRALGSVCKRAYLRGKGRENERPLWLIIQRKNSGAARLRRVLLVTRRGDRSEHGTVLRLPLRHFSMAMLRP